MTLDTYWIVLDSLDGDEGQYSMSLKVSIDCTENV